MSRRDDDVADELAGAVVAGAVIMAVFMAIGIGLLARELIAIYAARTRPDQPAGPVIKRLTLALGGTLATALLLTLLIPELGALAGIVSLLALAIWCLGLLALDARARPLDADRARLAGSLGAYLPPPRAGSTARTVSHRSSVPERVARR